MHFHILLNRDEHITVGCKTNAVLITHNNATKKNLKPYTIKSTE